MAKFTSIGLDKTIAAMSKLGELSKETAKKMIMVGAAEMQGAWKAAAEEKGVRDTGRMIDAIAYPKQPKTVNSVLTIDVYPQGKYESGVRTVEVAFIQHYGSSSIESKLWVDLAEEKAQETVPPAMIKIWDDFIEKNY